MKICLFGAPPETPTGMGIVLTNIAEGLSERGHDLVWVSRSNYARKWKGHRVVSLPTFGQTSTYEILSEVLEDEQPDVFFTNRNWQDLVGIHNPLNAYRQMTNNSIDVVFHASVESEEPPMAFGPDLIDKHENPVHYLPYTQPGYEMFAGETTTLLGEEYEYCRDYIPHGISEDFFEPADGGVVGDLFDDADAKIVSTVAGNESKKNLDLWLRAAGAIKEQYDGDVKFVMHTTMSPDRGGGLWDGWELPRLAAYYGIHPAHDIQWTKKRPGQDLSERFLADLYADSDLYMSLSGGEGFGLPVAEALAHHTPCVLTDHVNHRYVAGEGAEYAEIAASKHTRTGDIHLLPDAEDAAASAVSILSDNAKAVRLAESGYAGVEERFRWEQSVDKLDAYLEEHV